MSRSLLLRAVGALSIVASATLTLAVERPTYPDAPNKESLVVYQEQLASWGNQTTKNADEFWKATCDEFYKSTKALLEQDLSPEERVDYHARFAGVLGGYATEEALANKGMPGEKYQELRLEVGKALQRYALDQDKETREIFLAYANQLFAVRLNYALTLTSEERDEQFVAIVGDAITFALRAPEFGETAHNIVTTVRVYSPELGEEALDALCEAFEASDNPVLLKPIQKTLGKRRFARLPGSAPYFEAMLLDGKEFTKKFDPKEYENKVLLIEVWATWCGPCKREIPRLKEVYEKYRDAGFEIIGYSIDQDVEFLKKFLVDNDITWSMASQKRSIEAGFHGLYDYYSINGVPEMILVGRDGNVIMTDARGCKLADQLKELFPDVEPLDWDPAEDFSQRVANPSK